MRASAVPPLAAAILTLALLPAHAADSGGLVFVPWKILNAGDPAPSSELVLYWIPLSSDDFRHSELLTYPPLTTYSRDCVSLSVIRADDERAGQGIARDRRFVLLALREERTAVEVDEIIWPGRGPAAGARHRIGRERERRRE